MTSPSIRALRALSRHDWATMADLKESAGIYGPAQVTACWRALKKLAADGLVERDGLRYRITNAGRAAIKEQLARVKIWTP